MSGEKKYCLANLPAKTDLRTLATTIKARWVCNILLRKMIPDARSIVPSRPVWALAACWRMPVMG
jgi:hypothetical protein